MIVQIDQQDVFIATGGSKFEESKPTIIYLHGSGLNSTAWVALSSQFPRYGFNVIIPDFPGHGYSSGESLESIEKQSHFVKSLIDTLKCSDVTIIGHSQGGLVGIEYCSQHQDVKGLVLMNSSHRIAVHPELIKLALANDPKPVDMMLKWAYAGHEGNIMTEKGQLLAFKKSIDVASMILHSRELSKTLAIDFIACDQYQRGKEASKKITASTFILSGGQDKMTPKKFSEELLEYIPNSKMENIDQAGHMLTSEEVVEVRNYLGEFILNLYGIDQHGLR